MNMRKLLQALVCLPLFLLASVSFAQTKTVTGRVTDAAGKGLVGVTVAVKGQSIATITGETGSYSIQVPSNSTTLVFTSVGFSPIEMSIDGKTSLDVSMQSSAASLNEIVVIGYGTSRKKDLTGAVTSISEKDFNQGAITTPEQLIAGKVAGVQITSNGGAPGAGSTIRIRGGASLNASNSPLIVIDGVPVDNGGIAGAANPLQLINPNDIESFNILKDASATAIYGSRASNGVIIITTKKGRRGPVKFSFSSQNTLSTLPKQADVLSPDEFRTFVKANGTQAQIALLGNANTNWQDEVFDNAFMTDNNISASGSLGSLPYRVSLGYLNQDGILITGNLERTSASLNLDPILLNGHLKVNLNVKGTLASSRFANEGAIGNAVRFDPTQPVRTGSKRYNGYFEWLDPNATTGLINLAPRNPVGLLEQRMDVSDVKRSIGNLQLDYKFHFLPELRANLNLGYDVSRGTGTIKIPDSAASVYKRFFRASTNTYHSGVDNQYKQEKSNQLLEAYLNYANDIATIKSRVDALVGYSYQDFLTTNYNYPDRTNDGVVVSAPVFPFDKPQNRLISFFGRVNYTLMNKYLLTGTIRRDGSSRFAEENRWGWFPSAAFAWRISEEGFLVNSKTVSDLKLRLGYGVTGQQDGIGLYDYIPRYAISNQQAQYQFGNTFYQMYRPAGYNPNLKWEQTATANVGLDYGFLNNRISGSIDFYHKKTEDLLSVVDQPAGTNFSNKVIANIGTMENRGVEFVLNLQPVRNKSLTWDFGFNITYNKNEITKLTFTNDPTFPGNLVGGIAGGVGSTIQIHSVGFASRSFYVYKQVYDKNGQPIEGLFEDLNRDGIINNNDLYRYMSPDPKVFLGANSAFNWNNWNAGFSLRANFDNYVYNNRFSNTGVRRNIIDPLGFLANGSKNLLETRFTGNGDQYLFSDYYVENASFLRMDNMYLGYNAGDLIHRKTNLRITATVQNAFVVTKYRGLDPEVFGGIDNNFYPRPRNFVLGLNLEF